MQATQKRPLGIKPAQEEKFLSTDGKQRSTELAPSGEPTSVTSPQPRGCSEMVCEELYRK